MVGYRLPGTGVSVYIRFYTHAPRDERTFVVGRAFLLFQFFSRLSTRANRPVARIHRPSGVVDDDGNVLRTQNAEQRLFFRRFWRCLSPGENRVCTCNKCFYSLEPWPFFSPSDFRTNMLFLIRLQDFLSMCFSLCVLVTF